MLVLTMNQHGSFTEIISDLQLSIKDIPILIKTTSKVQEHCQQKLLQH